MFPAILKYVFQKLITVFSHGFSVQWISSFLSATIHTPYIPNSKKVALGIGKWALVSYCLVVTQGKHCIVFVCPNAQSATANDQLAKQLLMN